MNIRKEISCKDDYDPSSITPAEALKNIFGSINPVNSKETVDIRDALDRILAKDISSLINVPSGTNSAMDGYAINALDLPESGTKELHIAGTSFAGKPFKSAVEPGQCVRIMTGAILPAGTDTVVIQEHVEQSDNTIKIGPDTKPGENVRQAGEDIKKGDTILKSGIKLTPADLGMIASLGIGSVEVRQKLKVAFFSTGDELKSIGEDLEDGAIYDSNRYTLFGMLTKLNCNIIDMGVVKDDKTELNKAFQDASKIADAVITTGGVSVGDADYVKETLISLGKINFWKVAMKPGRPLTFGKINNACFFGLPGNPVSVMVTFYQFVQPALKKMMEQQNSEPLTIDVPCISRLKKKPGRVEYQRGILERDDNNDLVVRKTGAQGSGILHSMSDANCFILLPLDNSGVEPGEMVSVQPFFGLI